MSGHERIIKQMILTTVTRCAACGRPYHMDNVRILGHQDDLWFLMIICNHCRSHGLIAALIKEEHITEIVTDLTPREMEKIREAAAIGADDVLDMHEFLQEFDGDFLSLFRGQEES